MQRIVLGQSGMVAQPARMSHLIVEQEQRLPSAAFDDVQLATSGLDQLFSPRHDVVAMMQHLPFIYVAKAPHPPCSKGEGERAKRCVKG